MVADHLSAGDTLKVLASNRSIHLIPSCNLLNTFYPWTLKTEFATFYYHLCSKEPGIKPGMAPITNCFKPCALAFALVNARLLYWVELSRPLKLAGLRESDWQVNDWRRERGGENEIKSRDTFCVDSAFGCSVTRLDDFWKFFVIILLQK